MGKKKIKLIEKGSTIAIYIPIDTPDHIIEYLNEANNISKALLQSVRDNLDSANIETTLTELQDIRSDVENLREDMTEIKELLKNKLHN